MKITYLWIDGYKNLNDIEITFEENSSVNVFIGNNGSGKSNIIEAIVQIFTSLKYKAKLNFEYVIKFIVDDDNYKISFLENKQYYIKNDYNISAKDFMTSSLPSVIFSYYAGETNRLEQLSSVDINKGFKDALKDDGEVILKYLSFISIKDFAPALISNFVFNTKVMQKISELIDIEEVSKEVKFILKRPNWSKSAKITEDSFWNAQGTVANVLHQIKDIGTLTITGKDSAEIKVDDVKGFKNINENAFDLLVKLKLLVQADILENIDIKVMKNSKEIESAFLSEGEKQIIQLLCFLEATKEYKALFLLDEIDSYLHPNWQRKFTEIIGDIEIKGQILFTTHSPLTIGKMNKNNIRIIKNGEIFIPKADTFNRDVSEVMEEIMDIGLRPVEVEKTITDFRNNIVHGNVEVAMTHYETLKVLLSEEDPFWITANNFIKRFGGQK